MARRESNRIGFYPEEKSSNATSDIIGVVFLAAFLVWAAESVERLILLGSIPDRNRTCI